MQNSCKASSHRPEQNSSFYFVEKAIDFPYELRLYSDSVYSWAVTGLPKAALQTSCSLTTSVVIILLSGRDNLKCPRSSEMQGRQQELLTFFFLTEHFQCQRMAQPWTFIQGFPHLTVIGKHKASKALQPSLSPENSASWPGMTLLTPWKPSWSPESAVCACPAEPQEGHPREGLSANHRADVTSLSNSSSYSASFGLALKNKRKLTSSKVLVTCSCFSSLLTLYSKLLSQESLMLDSPHLL